MSQNRCFKGFILTTPVRLPGVEFPPERNAVEVRALNLPKILRSEWAFLTHKQISQSEDLMEHGNSEPFSSIGVS